MLICNSPSLLYPKVSLPVRDIFINTGFHLLYAAKLLLRPPELKKLCFDLSSVGVAPIAEQETF